MLEYNVEDWEEEFDRLIHGYHGNDTEVEVKQGEFLFKIDRLKDFIATLIAQTRDADIKIVEGISDSTEHETNAEYLAVEETIDKILKALRSQEKLGS